SGPRGRGEKISGQWASNHDVMFKRSAYECQHVRPVLNKALVGHLPGPPVAAGIRWRNRQPAVGDWVRGVRHILALFRFLGGGGSGERKRAVGVQVEIPRLPFLGGPDRIPVAKVWAALEHARFPGGFLPFIVQKIAEERRFDVGAKLAGRLVSSERNYADAVAL